MFQVIRKPATERKTRIIEPIPYALKPLTKRLAIFDTETDPFKYGVSVKPFTCGLHFPDTGEYYDFWGDDCIEQFFAFLDANYAEEALLIVCHNWGNFDFHFCVDHLDPETTPFIMNGRFVRCEMHGQEFRDSYSIIPVALAAYEKTTIDYDKFTRENRETNKAEIRAYQKDDCVFLGELVSEFYRMFGDRLTIAGVALPTLRGFHGFETMHPTTDDKLRPYYFGGRNQCFEVGELAPRSTPKWTVYDVRSMYPTAMKTVKHPVSAVPLYEAKITSRTHFAHINATSWGALPVRNADGGLSFPYGERRDFHACIHEIRAGLETGLLKIHKVHSSIYFEVETSFAEFIDQFFALRDDAKRNKDKVRDLLYKLVMNSSYGKFAQDPRKYERFLFDPETPPEDMRSEDEPNGWYVHTIRDGRVMFARPQQGAKSGQGFFNVATAASITSASRAILLRGISKARRPIYCDTDSIICEFLDVPPDTGKLGDWEVEAEGDVAAIAGKKLYAVFNGGEEIKKASKGVRLTAEEIMRVCRGEVVEYANPVPKFKLDGKVEFITRNIRRTA